MKIATHTVTLTESLSTMTCMQQFNGCIPCVEILADQQNDINSLA